GTSLDPSSFSVGGSPRESVTLEELEEAIDGEIQKIIDDGVTDTELQRAKDRLVRNMIYARDSQSAMARIFGSTLTTGGTVNDVLEWPDRIRAVTRAAVQEVAARYLKHPTTAYLLPPATEAQAQD